MLRYLIQTFYKFDLGKPKTKRAWSTGYFLPIKEEIARPPLKENMNTDLLNKIKKFKPDLIAVSCYSNQFEIVKNILETIKSDHPNIPNIVGGCHPSFCAEEVIAEPFIDFICVGEGEEAFVDICDRLENKEKLTEIQNIWTKKDGVIIRNPVRKPIDLNEIGRPDWSAFDPIHINQPFHGKYYRVGMVEFGRGCPHKCSYCANASYIDTYEEYKSSYIRTRNPDSFIKTLKYFKDKYELELIYFQDGTFLTMPNDVLSRLASLYEKEINLPCIILSTATSINEIRLKHLKRMKCISVNIGIEVGNPQFREKHLNRKMSNKRLINAFAIFKENGIATAAYCMLGFPYETRDNVFETIELCRQCSPDSIYPQIFTPIHGSQLYDWCINEGYFDPEDESLYNKIKDRGNICLLKNIVLSRSEIAGLLKTFQLYVKMPKYFAPFIKLLENDNFISRKNYYFFDELFLETRTELSHDKKTCMIIDD